MSSPNSKGEYQVRVGVMTVWVAADRLQPYKLTNRDKSAARKVRVASGVQGGASAETIAIKIDLHGKTVREAESILETTLDSALVNGATVIEVVHGLGSGKIKSLVHRFAASSPHVAELREDMANPGRCLLYL